MHLQPAVWQSLLAVVDADDNGHVEWSELIQFMGDIFQHIERERVLSQHVKVRYVERMASLESNENAVAVRMRESQDMVRVQLATDEG